MKKVRVLIADDEPDIRFIYDHWLSRDERFEVVGAVTDGQAAIEAAEALKPDVVLLDISMPVLDGLAAVEDIRAQGCAIVFISGYLETASIGRVCERHDIEYLYKSESCQGVAAALLRAVGRNCETAGFVAIERPQTK